MAEPTFYFDQNRFNVLFDQAKKDEEDRARQLALYGINNQASPQGLPIGPWRNFSEMLLSGLLYGGENIGGQILSYIAGESQPLTLPSDTQKPVRYAIIYPENDNDENVKIGYYSFIIPGYASDAVTPKIPIYGRKPIRISGAYNLSNFYLVTTVDGPKYQILYFG